MAKMTLLQSTSIAIISLVLFVLIIGLFALGHRLRSKLIEKDPTRSQADLKTINGMLLGLLGLLLAFTFGMANSRFNARRDSIVQEANIIGTTILRADIYPDSMRTLLRKHFRDYLEERIAFYEAREDVEKAMNHYHKGDAIGEQIWDITASYAKVDNITTRTSEFIPSLNDMLDITITRRAANEATIPDSIVYFLFALCLGTAFLLGYDHQGRIDWIMVIGFSTMLSATVLTILDLDRPRGGFIKLDVQNEKMIELRQMFKGD
jgi:hypothetical protein